VCFGSKEDCLNTTSSNCCFEIIPAIENNPNVEIVQFNWLYGDDDEELLEIGAIYAEIGER
jgi:hypothetical protein